VDLHVRLPQRRQRAELRVVRQRQGRDASALYLRARARQAREDVGRVQQYGRRRNVHVLEVRDSERGARAREQGEAHMRWPAEDKLTRVYGYEGYRNRRRRAKLRRYAFVGIVVLGVIVLVVWIATTGKM
jgi:hypothetical protein